ncbi:hypothetical protein, partial [Mycobacterium sp.]|uniref:hypothetical protein n=1 Tax=Mycobacterium sp. TaxID=1785 RepID=UPI003F9D051C
MTNDSQDSDLAREAQRHDSVRRLGGYGRRRARRRWRAKTTCVSAVGALALGGVGLFAGSAAASPTAAHAQALLPVASVARAPRAIRAATDRTQVGTDLPLSAGGTLTAQAGERTGYRWSIVARPGGSHARLIDVSSAHPRLRPDRPGVYKLRVAIGSIPSRLRGALSERALCAHTCSIRTLRVTATVPTTALGVPVQTIAKVNGDYGVQVGTSFYAAPDQQDALQLVVLDRSTLALVQNSSFTNDVAGTLGLLNAVSALASNDLVIITKPNISLTNVTDPGNAQQAAIEMLSVFSKIGVAPTGLKVSVVTGTYGSCFKENGGVGCSAFSAIGIPGTPVGQGSFNPGLNALSSENAPSAGELKGWFQQDLTGNSFAYVDYARVPIDTGDPNADPAVVTVGSNESGSPVPLTTFTSPNLTPGPGYDGPPSGFFVVVLDAGSLTEQWQQTFPDDVSGLQNMASWLQDVEHDPTALVIVRSIGTVGQPAGPGAGATAWDQIAGELSQLGGSQLYFDALSGVQGYDQYAQVGPAGTPGYPGPWTKVATGERGGAARVTALLARNTANQFYPDESYSPNIKDPSRPLAGTLPGLMSLPLGQWPDQGTTGEQNVLNCIAANIDAAGPLATPIESNYTDMNLVTDWAGWASEISGSGYYAKLSSDDLAPGKPCAAFTQTDFDTVVTQLSTEWTDVASVWTMIANMQTPLTESQGAGAQIESITNAVNQDIGTSYAAVQDNTGAILGATLSLLSTIPGFSEASNEIEFVTDAISFTSLLNPDNDGINALQQKVTTTGANLGAELESRYMQSFGNLDSIGDILVGDWTKLQAAAQNAADTTNAAADWSWGSEQFATASDALALAARQTAYQSLFPLAYHLYRLTDGDAPGSGATNARYECDYVTGANGFEDIVSWYPFASEPASFDSDIAVVSGDWTKESWLYAAPDPDFLDRSGGTTELQFPTQDLLNAMFTTPQNDPLQTAPLFTPLQFAVETYNDGTANTITVTHTHIST